MSRNCCYCAPCALIEGSESESSHRMKRVIRYELQGTCLDPECEYQHVDGMRAITSSRAPHGKKEVFDASVGVPSGVVTGIPLDA